MSSLTLPPAPSTQHPASRANLSVTRHDASSVGLLLILLVLLHPHSLSFLCRPDGKCTDSCSRSDELDQRSQRTSCACKHDLVISRSALRSLTPLRTKYSPTTTLPCLAATSHPPTPTLPCLGYRPLRPPADVSAQLQEAGKKRTLFPKQPTKTPYEHSSAQVEASRPRLRQALRLAGAAYQQTPRLLISSHHPPPTPPPPTTSIPPFPQQKKPLRHRAPAQPSSP